MSTGICLPDLRTRKMARSSSASGKSHCDSVRSMPFSRKRLLVYEVLIERRVERDLKRLPLREFNRITRAMKELAQDPRPSGSRKLVGSERDRRVRVGDYR